MNSRNACDRCVHYRQPALISAVVKQQVSESHEDVAKAIDEVSAKDDAHRIEERAWLSAGAFGEGVWPHRPRTAAYCGLYETHDHYYVCQVKNAGGACADFSERPPAAASDCALCVYRIAAHGDSEDRDLLYRIAERIAYSTAQFPPLQAEYARKEKAIGAMKAFEVREVHRNHGWLSRLPRYVDYCRARSVPGRFEVPQCLNSRGDCERFDLATIGTKAPPESRR
jgi:hypothetical protein